jgi:hypothetical protein
MKLIAPVLLGVLVLVTSSAVADTILAKFKGGIGVIPVSNGVGTDATAETVTRNIVRGVQPAGQPWVIRDLEAQVQSDGSIRVTGRGLLLAGSNNIGGTANLRVFATLLCATNVVNVFTSHSTNPAGVALAPNGDFEIEDLLSPAPTACTNPVLLIRNTSIPANQGWFAAGIPDLN